MRLIDADRLTYTDPKLIDDPYVWAIRLKDIDKYTIKAVPVEYIYRRATEFSKMYSEKDLFTAKEIGLALVLIARDWEVENDKNI